MKSKKRNYLLIEDSNKLLQIINLILSNTNWIGLDTEYYKTSNYDEENFCLVDGKPCLLQIICIINHKIQVFIIDLIKI